MAIRIRFDESHNVIQPTFVLATKSGKKLGYIPATEISISDSFNSHFELEFKVNKEEDGVKYFLWDELVDFKTVWVKEWDVWFEAHVTIEDENSVTKTVSCISLGEAELSNLNLYNIEINTEDDIARDDYKPTVLYNAKDPEASLLHRIMYKAPHYTIKHVDQSIKDIQRTFSFDDISIYDAFQEISEEINCIFVIDSGSDDEGNIARSISVYDLESYCLDCGERGEFSDVCSKCGSTNITQGYGDDTAVFISSENIAENITIKTDTDSVKNCFRLEGGDELMTAAIISSNPNGSQYLWYFSDELRKDMSDELQAKLTEYDELYKYYNDEHTYTLPGAVRTQYNDLVTKYKPYEDSLSPAPSTIVGYPNLMNLYYDTIDLYLLLHDSLMPIVEVPETSATYEAANLLSKGLTSIAVDNLDKISDTTVSNAVQALAKSIVDPRYMVRTVNDIVHENTQGKFWVGAFTITKYSDSTDTATTGTVTLRITDDQETYIRQKLDSIFKSYETTYDVSDLKTLFSLTLEDFGAEMKKYCLVSLNTYADAAQACLNLLLEQGVANTTMWSAKGSSMYDALYKPIYDKYNVIQAEKNLRDRELKIVAGYIAEDGYVIKDGMQTILDKERIDIQDRLDMEAFIGEELWLEFVAYRRESTYSNDNYISDGLNNSELFAHAKEFIEVATKEIYKSAELQHSITASLHNLLVIKEFEPIVDNFAVGNWIRVKIDEKVYRLRLISYTIDFDDLEDIKVEFSDVKRMADGVSDVESIISQAQSIAASYNAVQRQASKGKKSNTQLANWASNGLTLTKMKIIDSADNQNMTWDTHGMLFREFVDTSDEYSDKQIKIINKGLYVTDDNWRTSKAGIGDFIYWNPRTRTYEEAYGVIADTIVGNIILGQDVGVYNEDNSVELNENGLTITADATTAGGNKTVFAIKKKYLDSHGNEQESDVMYIDGDGNLVLNGTVNISSSGTSSVTSMERLIDEVNNAVSVESVTNYYLASDMSSGISRMSQGWTTTVQPISLSQPYLWNYEVVYGTNGAVINTTEPIVIGHYGASGDDGRGISSIIENFAVSSSNTEAPADSAFSREVQTTTPVLKYLWNYEIIQYTDHTTERTDKRVIGTYGDPGADGISVAAVTNYYLASPYDDVEDIDTEDFVVTIPEMTATNKYLWMYEIVIGDDGNELSRTDPTIIGMFSKDGVGIDSVVEYYQVSDSDSTPPSTWLTTVPDYTPTNKYLWNYEVTTYTDGNHRDTEKRVIGMYSEDGSHIWISSDEPTWTIEVVEYIDGNGNVVEDSNTSVYHFPISSLSDGVTPVTDPSQVSIGDAIFYSYYRYVVTGKSGQEILSTNSISLRGAAGVNTASVYLYARGVAAPAKPTGSITYTFATGAVSGSLGSWTKDIPSGTDPCWVILATASSTSTRDTIAASEWTTPIKVYENGTDGATGYNQASIYLYQRMASSPSKPNTATTYTFATGALSSIPSGWSRTMPASDGNPCWVTSAAAISQAATYSIPANSWSDVTKLVEDGKTPVITTSKENGVTSIYSGTTKIGEVDDGEDGITPVITSTYDETTGTTTVKSNGIAIATIRDGTSVVIQSAQKVGDTTTVVIKDGDGTQTLVIKDGADGENGTDGTDGINGYVHIAWANSADGRTGFSTSDSTGKSYLGSYTDSTQADSTDPTKYNWSLIKGADGVSPTITTSKSGGVTTVTITDVDSTSTVTINDGTDGRSVESIVNHYLATNASSGITKQTSGWSTDPQSTAATMTANKPYLWNYEETFDASNQLISETSPSIIGRYGVDGTDGKGIVSITEHYAINNSTTAPPDSQFSTNVQSPTETNRYLWNYETITYTVGEPVPTAKHIIGIHGVSIKTVTNFYLATSLDRGVTINTTGWTESIQTMDATNQYLWNYEVIKDASGNEISHSNPVIIGRYGQNGRGISTITDFYQVSSDPDTPPTGEWLTSPPSTTTTNKYLWNYEVITYTDNSIPTETKKRIIGTHGETGAAGVSITDVTNYYLLTNLDSGVTTSTVGWQTTPQTPTESKQYLWNYEAVWGSNSSSTPLSTTTPTIIEKYGDGRGIASITEYYQVSSKNNTAPTGTWSPNPVNTTTTNKYLWNYEVITYTDGSTPTETKKRVIGTHGETGAQGPTGPKGTSVSSIIPEYYLSTSKEEPTGGTWSTSPPDTWVSGTYLWSRNMITYTDPVGTVWTTPTCDYAWEQTVRGVNLSPFYSHDITDVYNATTNPNGYWYRNHATQNTAFSFTQLKDGWVHVHCDNSAGTATIRCDVCTPVSDSVIIPGGDYTFLVEIKNNASVATSVNSDTYIVQTNNCQFWGDMIKKNLDGIGTTSSGTDIKNVPTDGSLYTKRFIKTAEPSDSTHWTTDPTALCNITFRCADGDIIDYDYRISMYEGEYTGPYVPYTISDVSTIRKNAELAKNLELGGRNLLKASNTLVSNANYNFADYYFGDLPPQEGETVTIRFKGELGSDRTYFQAYNSGGYVAITTRNNWEYDEATGIYSQTAPWQITQNGRTAENTFLRIYQYPNGATSSSTIEWIKLERGNKATDWTPAPEDVAEETQTSVASLQTLVNAQFQTNTENIMSQVSKMYYSQEAATGLNELVANLQTSINQNAEAITFVASRVDKVNEDTGALETKTSWMRFDANEALTIGRSTDDFNISINGERISFNQGGFELAYISNSKLYIKDGEFLGSLQLGNFAFVPNTTKKNLSFKKVIGS